MIATHSGLCVQSSSSMPTQLSLPVELESPDEPLDVLDSAIVVLLASPLDELDSVIVVLLDEVVLVVGVPVEEPPSVSVSLPPPSSDGHPVATIASAPAPTQVQVDMAAMIARASQI